MKMESETDKDLTHVDTHSHSQIYHAPVTSECYAGLVESHAGILAESEGTMGSKQWGWITVLKQRWEKEIIDEIKMNAKKIYSFDEDDL